LAQVLERRPRSRLRTSSDLCPAMTARAQATASLTLCLLALALAEPTCSGDCGASQADHEDVGLLQTLRKNEFQKVTDTPEGFKVSSAPKSNVTSTANPCADTDPVLDRFPCITDGVSKNLEQAGANITEGYVGGLDVGGRQPWNRTFLEGGLCPVNVHFHLGTEHLSVGQFDENGAGPPSPADEGPRLGFRCHLFDDNDTKFTTPFDWKYCVDMRVGETYEVHWPHSAAGACGTPFQYQEPFLDGVFCNAATVSLSPLQDKVGVHGQVFVIVNDEDFYYPDLFKGMIVDPSSGFGKDIAFYTGSTTGTSVNNEVCSAYSPVTWQVDRKCRLISASSFDKMCFDMTLQADDMTPDLEPHGARELVADSLAANNLQSS